MRLLFYLLLLHLPVLAFSYLDFQNAGFYRLSPPFMTYKFPCVIKILKQC